MEDNQNEKDLQKVQQVEASVENFIKDSGRELLETRYYKEFTINSTQGPITFENVFITVEKDTNNKMSYHFRWIDDETLQIDEKILIDDEGKVYSLPELEKLFENTEIDIEKVIEENDKRKDKLKGAIKKVEPEEKSLEGEEKENKQRDREDEEEKSDEEENEETQEVEEDLKNQGEDLEISNYKKIKDSNVAQRMPEVFGRGEEHGLAFSKKLQRFVIISKVNEQYQINENIEPAKMTMKNVTSIGADGEKVERKVPHALMKLPNNSEKEIAVTIDQYGIPDIETVDVLPCRERVSRQVRTEGEEGNQQESKETQDMINEVGTIGLDEIIHKKKELEETYKVTEIDFEKLKTLDIEQLMKKEAAKAGMSDNVDGFKKYVQEAEGDTLEDKIDNAHEEIEQDYRDGRRPR